MREAASAQGGSIIYIWLLQYREARQPPEFKALLRDLGIVRYWQEFHWPKFVARLFSAAPHALKFLKDRRRVAGASN